MKSVCCFLLSVICRNEPFTDFFNSWLKKCTLWALFQSTTIEHALNCYYIYMYVLKEIIFFNVLDVFEMKLFSYFSCKLHFQWKTMKCFICDVKLQEIACNSYLAESINMVPHKNWSLHVNFQVILGPTLHRKKLR